MCVGEFKKRGEEDKLPKKLEEVMKHLQKFLFLSKILLLRFSTKDHSVRQSCPTLSYTIWPGNTLGLDGWNVRYLFAPLPNSLIF